MNELSRRDAVGCTIAAATLGLVGCGASAADPKPEANRDVRVPLDGGGFRDIKGKEAAAYHTVDAWLWARLKEAETVRAGSSYANLVKHFCRDGGLAGPTEHRFVMLLCPFIKVKVKFKDAAGKTVTGFVVPADAVVAEVSPLYFEPMFLD